MVTEVRELKFKLLTVVAFTKFVKKIKFHSKYGGNSDDHLRGGPRRTTFQELVGTPNWP